METFDKNRNLLLIEGIILFVLGIVAVSLPSLASVEYARILGGLIFIAGLVESIRTFLTRHSPGLLSSATAAVLALVIGGLLILQPIVGVLTLSVLLTIFFLIRGIVKILLGLSLKDYSRWGWIVLGGILSLIMAALIYGGWPSSALWVLGLLVGLDMIFYGYSLIILWAELSPGK